ncbi:MAG: ATPase domain-containing protein [Anaerolineae bacterium]|nr:ATPase domain-containing protein [Anaerolineae bacterium]
MTTLSPRERLSFGSPALDEMVGGGLFRGSATLISGAPGVGKTTLGLQFLIAGIKIGQPALLVSFEEFPASLIRDAGQLGWDLKALEKDGLLRIIFTSPEVFLESLKAENSPLADALRTLAPERIVVDSAAHFQRLTNDPIELRDIYNTLVNAIRREGMTSLLLDETANTLQSQRGRVATLPFLVDTVMLLRYVEVDSAMRRAIAVMKMRGSKHKKEILGFEIQPGGLELGEPFTNRAGILSGTTYRTS